MISGLVQLQLEEETGVMPLCAVELETFVVGWVHWF